MVKGKKFIAPGAWFSMTYPADWHESEGGEESFLFYNPDDWDGNFRISAFRGEHAGYGQETVAEELKRSRRAQQVMVGNLNCAYSCEVFTEEGEAYENHQCVADGAGMALSRHHLIGGNQHHVSEGTHQRDKLAQTFGRMAVVIGNQYCRAFFVHFTALCCKNSKKLKKFSSIDTIFVSAGPSRCRTSLPIR